jgi:iron complex transport system permease protein
VNNSLKNEAPTISRNAVSLDHSARATLRKTLIVCGALTVMLIFIVIIAATLGSERLPVVDTLQALFTGGASSGTLTSTQRAILFDIRLPRILLAATVGASLAAAGASYQALLRNALAEPYLLGISNGAAVGTMVALVFLGANEWTRPVMAFAGALGATFVVYRLARGRAGASPERLILAGVIVTTFQSSVIVFITTLMDATRIRSFTFWLLGDLSQAASGSLWIAVVSTIAGVGLLTF